MGRQNKVGLDYFELDCHMDEKIKLIEAEFGLKGFAIVVKLYQSIYSGFGYYCEWTPDISLLWAMRLGVSHGGGYKGLGVALEEGATSGSQGRLGKALKKGSLPGFPDNLINGVVAASIRRGIFSKELFVKYRILTSSGIQKRYFSAVSKREKVEVKKEYLLFSIPQNNKNVVINAISSVGNAISSVGNTQSRVEKSREENNINIVHSEEMHDTDSLEDFFEKIWKLYPIKKGKGQISKTKKQVLRRIGLEELQRCIERFKEDMADRDKKYLMHGSTFFNSGYVDYLDKNYLAQEGRKEVEPALEEEEYTGDWMTDPELWVDE